MLKDYAVKALGRIFHIDSFYPIAIISCLLIGVILPNKAGYSYVGASILCGIFLFDLIWNSEKIDE